MVIYPWDRERGERTVNILMFGTLSGGWLTPANSGNPKVRFEHQIMEETLTVYID